MGGFVVGYLCGCHSPRLYYFLRLSVNPDHAAVRPIGFANAVKGCHFARVSSFV